MSELNTLLARYDQPVPRYTSYPTVPFWSPSIDPVAWERDVQANLRAAGPQGISLYIHLPFCESLCLYCGCNKKITTNHSVEGRYIDAVLKEWQRYLSLLDEPPFIREIHLGGGTPTFFSPGNLDRLITGILNRAVVHPDHAFSFEGHPNNTTCEHLTTLHALGFRRVSFGVQDLNPEVQQAIGRIQSFERLCEATEQARETGYAAVNFDLIYGLPKQTPERLEYTISRSVSLRPDRLAFYPYAHTPWLHCSQRLIDETAMPAPLEKLALYDQGSQSLIRAGYTHIGMDHFALPADELFTASRSGQLHRNFMGYTTQKTDVLIGLGVSAISDTGTAFAQNDKTIAGYYRSVEQGQAAVKKGHFLTDEDRQFRRHILDIACKGVTRLEPEWDGAYKELTNPVIGQLEADGIVDFRDRVVMLTPTGRTFLRHACKAFDLRLLRAEREKSGSLLRCGKSSLDGAPGRGPLFSSAV